MNAIVRRCLTSGVLAIWGGVLLAICLSGRLGAYLHPNFRPFAVAAGFVLVCFAVLTLLAPAPGASHGNGSRSTVRGILASLFLVGPLLLAFYTSNDGLDATAVANRNYVENIEQLPSAPAPQPSPAPSVGDQSLPNDGSSDQFGFHKNKNGELLAQVVDFLYAVQLPEIRSDLDGKPVAVIGQLMPAKTNNPKGDRYVLIRMVMTCCAADAQAVALPIEPLKKPDMGEMAWVRVTGRAAFPLIGGKRTPLIQNAVLEKIEPPEEPYLY